MLKTDYIKKITKEFTENIIRYTNDYVVEDVQRIIDLLGRLDNEDLYLLQDAVDTLITFREEREQDDEE